MHRKLKSNTSSNTGFSLIELIMVMLIIAILGGIGARSLLRVFSNANVNGTIFEMRILAEGIVGNPNITENNIRTNYGYIGDTGQLPPTLRDLTSNVSSVTGWDGPYIDLGFSDDPDYYLTDAWGNSYVYVIPSNPAQAPVIYTPADGDTLTQKIGNSVNELLNNAIKIRLLNAKNVEVSDVSGGVDIKYAGSYHSMTYDANNGFYTLSVPIGIHLVRALSAGDTVYKSFSVSPGNRTSNENIEINVFASYGNVTYVAGSAVIETSTQNEVYFDIHNSGATTMPINKMTLTWTAGTQDCWNCATPYLDEVDVSGTQHWKWNVESTALSPSGSQIVLGTKVQVYSGDMTLGPFIFMDAADGTGSAVDMRGTSFEILLQSQTAPTQTIDFATTGVCADPNLSLTGSITSDATSIYIPLQNTGYINAELNSIQVRSNISGSTAYVDGVFLDASTVWQANAVACGSVSRQRVDSNIESTITFTSCSYTNPTWTSNQTQSFQLLMYQGSSGTTPVTGGFSGTVFDFTLNYSCGTAQTLSVPIP